MIFQKQFLFWKMNISSNLLLSLINAKRVSIVSFQRYKQVYRYIPPFISRMQKKSFFLASNHIKITYPTAIRRSLIHRWL